MLPTPFAVVMVIPSHEYKRRMHEFAEWCLQRGRDRYREFINEPMLKSSKKANQANKTETRTT